MMLIFETAIRDHKTMRVNPVVEKYRTEHQGINSYYEVHMSRGSIKSAGYF